MSDEVDDGLVWKLNPNDVEWEMDWGEHPPGDPRKSGKEMIFEKDNALAHLLMNEVVFINSHWWKHFEATTQDHKWTLVPAKDARWTEEESKTISVSVNCSDVFAWGCSEAETLPFDQIETLYRMWQKDRRWGAAVWCMIQRDQMPQKPVEDAIRKAGVWNFDELKLGQKKVAP